MKIVDVILIIRHNSIYYENAIRSIIAQTYQHWHLIILVDRDISILYPKIFSLLSNYSFEVHSVDYKQMGIARIRNLGLSKSKNDLIAFLDDDDVYLPQKLEDQVRIIEASNDIYFVTCFTEYFASNNNNLYVLKPKQNHNGIVSDLLIGNIISQSSILFRKSKSLQFEYQDLIGCEDYDFFLRYVLDYNFYGLQKVLVKYLDNPLGISKKKVPLTSSAKLFWSYLAVLCKSEFSLIIKLKRLAIFLKNFYFDQNLKLMLVGRQGLEP